MVGPGLAMVLARRTTGLAMYAASISNLYRATALFDISFSAFLRGASVVDDGAYDWKMSTEEVEMKTIDSM
jgi:hypothetical protein